MHEFQYRHRAMATEFEFVLIGDDLEHLQAVAALLGEEIDRVQRLLSRFDPASEVSRINRTAQEHAVLVDFELAAILHDCRAWWERTQGAFDIVASLREDGPRRLGWQQIDFDATTRQLRFHDPTIELDFGAYGKGYALDCAARYLAEHRIAHARLHGGTSSILLRGCSASGEPWQVAAPPGMQLPVATLTDIAISTSVVFHPNQAATDITDPTTGLALQEQRYCLALCDSAATAEVLSTSGLLLGPQRLAQCLANWTPSQRERMVKVYWQAGAAETAVFAWPMG